MISAWVALAMFQPVAAPVAQDGAVLTPSVDTLAASAEACTGKLESDQKMRERWLQAGWLAGERVEPQKGYVLALYSRNDVKLQYFTSKIMTTCAVRADIATDYDVEPLVAAMTTRLGIKPKVEEPGRRYYFRNFRGLKILNLLVKEDKRGRFVELSVVD